MDINSFLKDPMFKLPVCTTVISIVRVFILSTVDGGFKGQTRLITLVFVTFPLRVRMKN